MNPLILTLLQTALGVAANNLSGKTKKGVEVGEAMLDIIAKARAVYEAETGLPLDVEKVKPYTPIP